MVTVRLRNAHCFDDDVVDLLFTFINDFLAVDASKHLHDSGVGAFAADVVLVLVFVLHVVGRLLVDGVVGQVHEQIVEVGGRWSLVFLGGEAGQAILVDVDAHRCYTVDKHVKSEIELVSVNQTRFGQVSLNNHVLDRLSLLVVACQLVWVASQKYTLALA